VFGSAIEAHSRMFGLTVRSKVDFRKAERGMVAPTLFFAQGTGSSIGIPAPTGDDVYYFKFEQLGESSGREIIVHLEKRK
jgi:hypothetical protein